MSIHLMGLAWDFECSSPVKKLVLLSLCNWANDEGGNLFPSIALIAQRSGCSERQAQRVMHEFIDQGLLSVVENEFGGAPGSSRRYRIDVDMLEAMAEEVRKKIKEKKRASIKKSTQEGCHDVTGDMVSRVTSEAQTGDICDTRRVTFGTQTGDMVSPYPSCKPSDIEPSVNRQGKRAPARASPAGKPDDVDESVWLDWLLLRKAKRAPVTQTALDGIRREAEKAGIGLGDALRICCEKGWQSFRASWDWREETLPRGKRAASDDLMARNREATKGWKPPELRGEKNAW